MSPWSLLNFCGSRAVVTRTGECVFCLMKTGRWPQKFRFAALQRQNLANNFPAISTRRVTLSITGTCFLVIVSGGSFIPDKESQNFRELSDYRWDHSVALIVRYICEKSLRFSFQISPFSRVSERSALKSDVLQRHRIWHSNNQKLWPLCVTVRNDRNSELQLWWFLRYINICKTKSFSLMKDVVKQVTTKD